jgi:hypothetical protein
MTTEAQSAKPLVGVKHSQHSGARPIPLDVSDESSFPSENVSSEWKSFLAQKPGIQVSSLPMKRLSLTPPTRCAASGRASYRRSVNTAARLQINFLAEKSTRQGN